MTPEYGYLPFDTWKRIREKVAGTMSTVTGSPVNSSDVQLSSSFVVSKTPSCPKCGTTIFVNVGKCPKCGEILA
jgi:tRNA(Ile2) C34 agmatinyltransferase TiaS